MKQNTKKMILRKSKFRKLLLLAFIVLIVLTVIGLVKRTNVSAIECSEFEEAIFWSNCGKGRQCGGTDYYTWNIKNECPGEDCFIKNIEAKARVLSLDSEAKIGYAQISNTYCENPSKANYSDYLVYQKTKEAGFAEFIWDCGNAQDNNVCKLIDYEYNDDCFSVKVVSDKKVLVDIVKVSYTWCWAESASENGGENLE